MTNLRILKFAGRNGAGIITILGGGIPAGTRFINVSRDGVTVNGGGDFGEFIPATGLIYQVTPSDLSAMEFVALVELPE